MGASGFAAVWIGAGFKGGADTEWITCGAGAAGGLIAPGCCGAADELDATGCGVEAMAGVAEFVMTGCEGLDAVSDFCAGWLVGLPFFGKNKAMIQPKLSLLGFSDFAMFVLHREQNLHTFLH